MAEEMEARPTAWEDINPPTVSAQRAGQPSQYSDADARIVFRNELTACLALTAPVGMTEEARREWFAVAWDTLKHIPPSILAAGAKKARLKCDHPSKIVPTIVAETAEVMSWRKMVYRDEIPQLAGPKPDYVTPDQAAEILRQYGLKPTHQGKEC